MSCCGTGAELAMLAATDTREILLACRPIAGNLRQTDLSVPDVHCGACIHTVEKALGALEGVGSARVNLSTKRVTIKRRADIGTPPDFIETLRNVGYEAHLFAVDSDARDGTLPELIRALAVSGFAAGMLDLTGALVIEAATAANDSFLAEMLRRMQAAEQRRWAYRRSRISALCTGGASHRRAHIAWLDAGRGDWHHAITIAVAVLIITCPCALGLAVPMVQLFAARRLFEAGIMIKDGGALERLAEVDTVVFDKTGTLTQGTPRFVDIDKLDPAMLTLASTIAVYARHPFSRALASVAQAATPPIQFDSIAEIPGCGM